MSKKTTLKAGDTHNGCTVKPACLKCGYLVPGATARYKCHTPGSCPAIESKKQDPMFADIEKPTSLRELITLLLDKGDLDQPVQFFVLGAGGKLLAVHVGQTMAKQMTKLLKQM